MRANAMKALEIDKARKKTVWEDIEEMIHEDAKKDAHAYVTSAKVDLGGE